MRILGEGIVLISFGGNKTFTPKNVYPELVEGLSFF